MMSHDPLGLHEEVLLLAMHDDKGTIASGTMYQYAIGGAVLAELLLRERIEVIHDRKKKLAEVVNSTPVGDPLLDECLAKIADDKKVRTLNHWVSKFASLRDLKHRVAERLCDGGILREEEGQVLLIFTRRTYPERDPRPENEIIERLRKAVFTDTREVDPRTVVLVSLADKAGLLKVVFDKKELKGRKARIEQVVNGELTGKAAAEAIQAMQAAVMVACIVPAITTAAIN